MFGIDEIYIELLNEAKSPEEIKKILRYQFVDGKGVPENIFEAVLSVDPTKKKNYTRWVLMQWVTERDKIISAVKLGQIKELFNYFKERSGSGLELGNMKSFTDALSVVPSLSNDPIFGVGNESDNDANSNDFDVVYDSDEWKIAVPNTLEASIKLGMGCKWCTAGAYGNTEHYYKRYTSRGKLWVNFDKRHSEITPMDKREYPYKRYQFCFEAEPGPELMDSSNNRIDIEKINIPSEVFEFYGEQNEDYAYILENAIDSEVVAERRIQRMLENCLLRKRGNGGNNNLLLLPIIYDGDISHLYRMYVSEDLSDPIDEFEYESNEIIDECSGFPVVFMRNSYNYNSYNVYYETLNRYNSWNGVMSEHYNWEVFSEVDICGGNNNLKYFIHKDEDFIMASFGPSTSDFISYRLSYMSFNVDIEDIKEVNFNGELPERYSGGIWLQVLFEDDHSGLWYIDNIKKDIVKIINKDIPQKDGFFKLVNDENGCFILSRTKKYSLSLNGESSNDDYYIVGKLEENDDFCIVSYNNVYSRKYGLYDMSTNEMIIKDVDNIEDYGKCVLLDYVGFSVFYDYKNKKYVSKKGENIKTLEHSQFYVYNPIDDYTHFRVFDTDLLTDHGPFDKVIKSYGLSTIEVVYDGVLKLYDSESFSFMLPDNSELIGSNDVLEPYLFVYKVNGENYLYSSLYKKSVLKLPENYEINNFNGADGRNKTILIKKYNNKFTIISSYGEILLPFDADYVISADNQKDKKYPIAACKNGKVYFVYSDTFITPKNGIPYESFVRYGINNNTYEKLRDVVILISINGKLYKVFYTPFGSKITSILDSNDNKLTDINELKSIERLFYPEKVQVSEQFKNIIDRMDTL